jgi:DNA invertase Pin-like site-specific DNA recombinase
MNKPKPKAYSYIRFSTPEQAAGDSLRRQTQGAEEYAARNGLDLDAELTFRDLGKSAFKGKNAETGALRAFLNAIEEEIVAPGSVLIVESLDRISRNVARKAVRVLEEIVEAGVDVVTLHDGKRYDVVALDGFDFIMAALIAMRGHEESETKSKRLKAAWSNKRSNADNGHALTAISPAWISATKGEKPIPIPERAKIVRRIFDEFVAGVGKAKIAQTLNADGVEPWGRGKSKAMHWHRSYVQKILSNPAVVGVFEPHVMVDGKRSKQEPIASYYPAVIAPETWKRAQALLGSSAKTKQRAGSVENILAGLAKCPNCGATMTRVMKGSGKKGGKPKLVCVSAKSGLKDVDGKSAFCTYRSVSLDLIEHALVTNADTFKRLVPARDSALQDQIDGLNNAWFESDRDLKNLVGLLAKNPSAAIERKVRELETQCDAMRTNLEALNARAAQSESKLVSHRAERLMKALNAKPLDKAVANAALRECFSGATVDYNAGELRLAWRHTDRDLPLVYDAGFQAL